MSFLGLIIAFSLGAVTVIQPGITNRVFSFSPQSGQ